MNIICKKMNAGYFIVEVMIDHNSIGKFGERDMQVIDDIREWLDGTDCFEHFESRKELEEYCINKLK
jgi:hypothetical protein